MRRGDVYWATLAPRSGGLGKDSVALCHQVITLDRANLSAYAGSLSDSLLAQVGEALKIAQDLP